MESMRTQLKDKKVSCRYCGGDHFTARCPYKDTLGAALGEGGKQNIHIFSLDSDLY